LAGAVTVPVLLLSLVSLVPSCGTVAPVIRWTGGDSVEATFGRGRAQTCSSFCPASATKIYNGNGINHAVAPDGKRYTELATAFAYREKIITGCTCNGRDAFGLVSTPIRQHGRAPWCALTVSGTAELSVHLSPLPYALALAPTAEILSRHKNFFAKRLPSERLPPFRGQKPFLERLLGEGA
jgi:hypothetical protein